MGARVRRLRKADGVRGGWRQRSLGHPTRPSRPIKRAAAHSRKEQPGGPRQQSILEILQPSLLSERPAFWPRVARDERPLREQQQRQPPLAALVRQVATDLLQLAPERGAVLDPVAGEEDEAVEGAGPAYEGDVADRGFEGDQNCAVVAGQVGERPEV